MELPTVAPPSTLKRPSETVESKKIIINCDGSCLGNPGPGGWASVISTEDEKGELSEIHYESGGEKHTTNNKMELMAAIQSIHYISKQKISSATITTDSSYVKQGITEWIHGWKRKNWKTSKGTPVLNQELWKELDALHLKHKHLIQWKWVKGHSGDAGNERADELARAMATSYQESDALKKTNNDTVVSHSAKKTKR